MPGWQNDPMTQISGPNKFCIWIPVLVDFEDLIDIRLANPAISSAGALI